MATLSGTLQWKLELTTEEFNLVSQALRGTLQEERKEGAISLCNRITKLRATAIREQLKTADRLDQVVSELS